MKYLLQKSRLAYLLQQRNGYLVLASGSLMLNILLSTLLFFMVGQERIIVVPPDIPKSFWLTATRVSPEYLSDMAIFLNGLSFNITPSNASMQHSVLLRYVDPANYESLKIKLMEVENRIKKEHITMGFYPDQTKVDANKLEVMVIGEMQYSVGDIQLPLQRVTYQYTFRYTQGKLTLASFSEIKNHA